MTKEKATSIPEHDDSAAPETLREAVLETLLELHLDFCALGRIDQAGPLLHSLMEMAYYAQSGQKGSGKRRLVKSNLN